MERSDATTGSKLGSNNMDGSGPEEVLDEMEVVTLLVMASCLRV